MEHHRDSVAVPQKRASAARRKLSAPWFKWLWLAAAAGDARGRAWWSCPVPHFLPCSLLQCDGWVSVTRSNNSLFFGMVSPSPSNMRPLRLLLPLLLLAYACCARAQTVVATAPLNWTVWADVLVTWSHPSPLPSDWIGAFLPEWNATYIQATRAVLMTFTLFVSPRRAVVACHCIALVAQQQRGASLPPAQRPPPLCVPILSR
jgi:hypothetical protein